MHGLRESSSETSWLSHTSGVYTVLKSAVVRSEIVLRSWHLADGQQATKPVYCSEDRYTHTHLTALFPGLPGEPVPERFY